MDKGVFTTNLPLHILLASKSPHTTHLTLLNNRELVAASRCEKMSMIIVKVIRQAQEALDFIATTMQASTEHAIISTDLQGKILRWNEGAHRLYGYHADAVVGKANTDILYTPEDVAAGRPKQIQEAALREGKSEGKIEHVRKDNQRISTRMLITPRRDADGEPIGFLLISVNPSDESSRPKDTKSVQFDTHPLIESNFDALLTTDPLGIISDVNEQMELMTGYQRDFLIGSAFKNYFTTPKRAEEGIKLALRENRVTNFELTMIAKDGHETVVSYNASTFRDVAGTLQGIFAAIRDITEQKKLERQVRDSEAHYRNLIEASADALFAIASDGRITDVNAEAVRLTGYNREHLIGSQFSTYFTDRKGAGTRVEETLGRGRVISDELVLINRHGRQIGVSFYAGAYTEASGTATGILAALRDVSEQRKLEQQISDQQYYARTLIDSNIDALVITDSVGNITDANRQMEQLTGCSRIELIGTPFKTYFTDPMRAEEGIRKVLRHGKVDNYDLTALAKDGKETVVSYSATIFNDRDGKLFGVFATFRNVTESKRAESHFRSLLESAPEAMVMVSQEGRIVLVNSQTEKLFGYDRSELLGQLVETLVPKRHYMDLPVHNIRYFQNPRTLPMAEGQELFGVRKNGVEFPIEISLSSLESQEGILVIRDISERKHVERAIQAKNEELERANQAKDRFLASMSHELRTPLNAIIGFTGTLLMKLPGPLNDEQQEQLQIVERSATHLLSLINDLLDLAKIESGTVEFNVVPVSCQGVIDEVVETLKPLAGQKHLELAFQVPDQEVLVHTDRRALTQILLNLTSNALKFAESGAVEIALKQYAEPEGLVTTFSVTNAGSGIRPEDQRMLFQAFQQLPGQHKAAQQGTGLGLYVSQKLANLLGGQIDFESEPDKGSTFTLVMREK